MRIYLASRYSRYKEMQRYAADLKNNGHIITSRWIEGNHQVDNLEDENEFKIKFASEDFEDVCNSNCIISFTEIPRANPSRGGRHVEFGIGLGRSMKLLVVGYRENIFHCLPQIEFYSTWEKALDNIKKWAA